MGKFEIDPNYVQVNERIAAFHTAFPEGSLQTTVMELTDTRVLIRAEAFRTPDDQRPGIGHSALAIPGSTPYTRGSEVENAETSAWGRALAALGFEVKRGIATAEEVANHKDEAKAAPAPPVRAPVPAVVGPPVETGAPEPPEIEAEAWADLLDETVAPPKAKMLDHLCPVHGMSWQHVVGTNAKGAYDFWSCPSPRTDVGYCQRRPPQGWAPA